MPILRVIVGTAFGIGLIAAGSISAYYRWWQEPELVHVYDVMSDCGYYATIHIWSDGTSIKYDWYNRESTEAGELAKALPNGQITRIKVPCPEGTVVPQRDLDPPASDVEA